MNFPKLQKKLKPERARVRLKKRPRKIKNPINKLKKRKT